MNDPANYMEWIERLGGWAVVFFVVRWMITRIDRQLEIMGSAITEFSKFQVASERAAEQLIKTQERIVGLLDKVEERLRDLEHKCIAHRVRHTETED